MTRKEHARLLAEKDLDWWKERIAIKIHHGCQSESAAILQTYELACKKYGEKVREK